jgi:hypothetical protein
LRKRNHIQIKREAALFSRKERSIDRWALRKR